MRRWFFPAFRPLVRSPALKSRLSAQNVVMHRRFASVSRPRGFLSTLQFATIQPVGQLTPQDFRFKAALVVNTASKCSHALQLKGMQQLHEKYGDQGLVVVAVPSNDFAGQEPGDSDEIREQYAKFGVTFAITEKSVVSGDKAHPFFKKIADRYSASVAPTWNFDKFLVDHRGDMRAVFPNDTDPLVPEVVAEIEEVLDELPRALSADQEEGEDEEEYDFDLDEDSDSDSDSDSEDDEEEDEDEDEDDDDDDDDDEKDDNRRFK